MSPIASDHHLVRADGKEPSVPQPRFLKVAAATLKAAILLVNPGMDTRLRAIEEWASVVFAHDPAYDLQARDLQRQIDSVIDRAARFLENVSYRNEYKSVDERDLEAALVALDETLNASSKYFTSGEMVRHAITPSDAVSLLTPTLKAKCSEALISEGAQEFARSALDVCCYQLVSWAQQVPSTQNLAAWTVLANTWALIASTDEIIQELRDTGLAHARDPHRVISSQRRDIANVLGKMELFGLPVESRYRRIPISVSYVMAHGSGLSRGKVRILPFEDVVSSALGPGRVQHPGQGLRLLVKGRAGSGKTTAAQWLVHQSAVGQLGDLDRSFGSTVPFFVRLRSALANEPSIPSDSALLMSGQLREGLGADWIENLGREHRPLIVLDGWDEVKFAERGLAAAWLASLCQRFTYGHIIVTSRPEGASDGVFAEQGFTETTLAPLGQEQKRQLISRWFDGLRKNLHQSPDLDEARLTDAEQALLTDIRGSSLSELTDTPLIAAMLCCLYASSTARNLIHKGALYQNVTRTLIHSRDEDRGVYGGAWDELLVGQKEDILGAVALQMIGEDALQLPILATSSQSSSLEMVTRRSLPKFGKSLSLTEPIIHAMLDRSMVLQRVGDQEAEFVHRTFQEFLSSSFLARKWESGRLFHLIEQDVRLLPMLPFAIYAAEQKMADEIVRWLLQRSSVGSENEQREALFILIECLAGAKELDPVIREGAIEAAEGVFPPVNSDEARSIATLRDAAVSFLEVEKWSQEHDEYCIETLARIGSRSAVSAMGRYASARGDSAKEFLVRAWDKVHEANYVDLVLSRVSSGLRVSADSPERLREITSLRGTSAVKCEGFNLSDDLLQALSGLPKLEELALIGCRGLAAANLPNLHALRSLRLEGIRNLGEVDDFGTKLLRLELNNVSALDINWERALARCKDLEVLRLKDLRIYSGRSSSTPGMPVSIIAADAIKVCKQLRILEILTETPGDPSALEFLEDLRILRVLRLSSPITGPGLDRINGLGNLRTLGVSLAKVAEDDRVFTGRSDIVNLEINSGARQTVESLVGFKRLSTLKLTNTPIDRISTMPLPDSLKKLEFVACDASGLGIPGAVDFSDVQFIRWHGGFLESLDFVRKFPRLRKLEILEASDLRDVSGLFYVADGCQVEISGTPEDLDDSVIEDLRDSGRCFITYRPRAAWKYDQYDSGGS